MSTADECRGRLEREGWAVEESGPLTPQGCGRSVSGTHGGAAVQAWAHGRACRRAEALERLPPG